MTGARTMTHSRSLGRTAGAMARRARGRTLHAGLASLLLTLLLAAGCQLQGIRPLEPAPNRSWLDAGAPLTVQSVVLVKNMFARVPFRAVIRLDDARTKVEFVAVSDWGMKLAEASFVKDDVRPTNLHPMLARLPGLAQKLSHALARVFLVRPGFDLPSDAPRDLDAASGFHAPTHFKWSGDPAHLLGKNGESDTTKWRVDMTYPHDSTERDSLPRQIVYRGDGIEIHFTITDARNE